MQSNPPFMLSLLAHRAVAPILQTTGAPNGFAVTCTRPDGSIDVAIALEVEAAALLWTQNADAPDVTITVTRPSERFGGLYETSIIPQKGE